jgi:hypothetical protein
VDKDFSGCNVLIHNTNGKLLCDVKIWEHNKNEIVIQDWPELAGVEDCKLLVMSRPSPHSYNGVMRKKGLDRIITLYDEKLEETRIEPRYDTNFFGQIEGLMYGEKIFPMHVKQDIKITSISKHGIRFVAERDAFAKGNMLQISVLIKESKKLLVAQVVNSEVTPEGKSEFGCKLLK